MTLNQAGEAESSSRSREQDASVLRLRMELLQALVMRELRTRYRGSYLGWAWALAKPLVMLFIYGLIIGVFLGAARSIPDFMLFIFVGLIAWNLFSAVVTGCIGSVIASGSLISKVNFPRLLLPTASIIVALVDTLIQGAVLLLGYLILGSWPALTSLAYLAPSLGVILLFGAALGLVLSAANVYVRDVGFITDIGLQVGFWLCPILYSYGFVVDAANAYGLPSDWITRIYLLNPMADAVLGFQRALWPPASTPDGAFSSFPGELGLRLLVLLCVGALLLLAAAAWFRRMSRNFAQEL